MTTLSQNPTLFIQKIEKFHNNPRLCSKFENIARKLPLPCILWPTLHYARFPKEFHIRYQKRNCVYPLEGLSERINYVEKKLTNPSYFVSSATLHPLLSYMYLDEFHSQLLDYSKSKAPNPSLSPAQIDNPKRKNPTEQEKTFIVYPPSEISLFLRRIKQLQKTLDVPRNVRRAKGEIEITTIVLQEMQKLSEKSVQLMESNSTLEMEWDLFRFVLSHEKKHGNTNRELASINQELSQALTKERQNSRRLHQELQKVSEQILTAHHLDSKSNLATEYQNLKNDYNLLFRKNDVLVSKNIELANQVKRLRSLHTHSLEHLLDAMRDRINALLKRQRNNNSTVLLRSIEKEAVPLQRARVYLAKVCYNLGILYLNSKEPHRALHELRAARELGLEVPESLLEKLRATTRR